MALIRTGGDANIAITSMSVDVKINPAANTGIQYTCKRGAYIIIAGRDNRWTVSGANLISSSPIGSETDSAVALYKATGGTFTFTPTVGTLQTTIMYEP